MPKRLRNGEQKGNNSVSTKVQTGVSGENLDVEAEILALGGTKEDYELIANAPSDSEYENNESKPGSSKSLQQELRKMVKDLDLENAANDAIHHANSAGDLESAKENSEMTAAKGSKIRIPPQSEWFSAELPGLPPATDAESLPMEMVNRLHEHAKALLEAENTLYARQHRSAASAHQFYSTIMISGTLSDKISALTLSVQESPIHNVKALESLLALARKRSRSQAVEVLGALKDLFGTGALLPPDRKLRYFSQQPGLSAAWNSSKTVWSTAEVLPKPLKEVHLISWAFEDWLKSTYFEVIKIIETWCNDQVVFARGKAVDYVFQLLREKPEQEVNLLRLLVNKLGDSDKKVASKASHSLLQLQLPHPLMKSTIITAIESDLLFRPGQSMHAKYYATITLNQTSLTTKQDNVTKHLLDIYFSLFAQLLAKPAAPAKDAIKLNKKGEVQGGGGSPGRKGRKKQAVKESTTSAEDQLREKILSAVLTGVNRAIPYTNTADESFEKHMDTLFKVTHSSNFNTSIQALILVQQLVGVRQATADRFYRTLYESLLDPRLLSTSKQTLYLNLLYRALRSDLSTKRVKAFVKRLLQIAPMHQAPFACAILYLVRELETVFPDLKSFIDQLEKGESDDEEIFRDVPEDRDTETNGLEASRQHDERPNKVTTAYDGRKRDPQHSNAENSCLWELAMILQHYHPSVSLFGTRLESHDVLPPKPDLNSNTLSHFLDRFVYRNPKVKNTSRGTSIMQPMAASDSSGLLVTAKTTRPTEVPVNSESFSHLDVEKVAPSEVFFHKYFSTTSKGKQQAMKKKEKRRRQRDDGSQVNEDEDEIWQALVRSRPELEGGDADEASASDGMESLADYSDSVSSIESRDKKAVDEEAEEDIDLEEDDGALLDSDEEVPNDLDKTFADEMETGKDAEDPASGVEKPKGRKKRKLKNLPTFASAEEYAQMLNEEN